MIFIDEADDLAGSRNGPDPFSKDSVNELLQRMDGLSSDARISVIAATNYPDKLDTAFLRRFDTRIFINVPDRIARYGIILNELYKAYSLPGSDLRPEVVELETDDEATRLKKRGMKIVSQRSDFKPVPDQELIPHVVMTLAGDNLFTVLGRFATTIQVVKNTKGTTSRWTRFTQGEVDTDTVIRHGTIGNPDVVKLVSRLGPQPAAKSIMEERLRKGGESEFSDTAFSLYGCSASDITKIVKRAVGIAAMRATEDRTAKNFSAMPLDYTGATEYYIFDPNEDFKSALEDPESRFSLDQLQAMDKEELAKRKTFEQINSYVRHTDRLLNFFITMMDFDKAITQFGSTVGKDEYEAVVKWKPSE